MLSTYIRNAPPPFRAATPGNRHTFPKPTLMLIHDIKNSKGLPQVSLPSSSSLSIGVGSLFCILINT